MPYLNIDIDYFEHPKTRRLIGLLGAGAAELPIRLWCYCGKYHPESGILTGHSPQEIEAVIGWTGKVGGAVDALVKVGVLVERGETYRVHQWKEHQGHIVAFKKRAISANARRWNKIQASYKDPTRTPKVDAKESSIPYHTIPYHTEEQKSMLFAFNALWDRYPNRQGKKFAWRSYRATVKTPEDAESISKALDNYLASGNVKKGFTKNGSTWFNNWQDWINPTETMMRGNSQRGKLEQSRPTRPDAPQEDKAVFS